MFFTHALEVGLLYGLTHIQLVFNIVTVLNYVSVYFVDKTEVDSSEAVLFQVNTALSLYNVHKHSLPVIVSSSLLVILS